MAYDAHGCASAASAGCARAAVDLNPVSAKICESLENSAHTSARTRLDAIEKDQRQGDQPLAPVLGLRGFGVLMLRQRDYVELVDHTGRQIRRAWMRQCRGRAMRMSGHPDKRGVVNGSPPAALARMGYTADRWQRQVLAVGSGYFRAIGAVDLLIEKAREIEQTWLRGIGVARQLERLKS